MAGANGVGPTGLHVTTMTLRKKGLAPSYILTHSRINPKIYSYINIIILRDICYTYS